MKPLPMGRESVLNLINSGVQRELPIWKVLVRMVWESADSAVADGPKEYSRFDQDSGGLVLIQFVLFRKSFFFVAKISVCRNRLGLVGLGYK